MYAKQICSRIILSLLLNAFCLFAQTENDSLIFLLNEFSEDEDNLAEIISNLVENPLNINKVTREELFTIPFLTNAHIDSIIKKQQNGFSSKRQLSPILGSELYSLVSPFFTIHDRKKQKFEFSQRIINPIENNNYIGSAYSTYNRIKYNYENLFLSLITQKDKGEQSFFDHYNVALAFSTKNYRIIAGDFYITYGQGVVFSGAYGSRKSTYIPAVFRTNLLRANPDITSAEAFNKRGVYFQTTLPFYATKLFIFYSNDKKDATIANNYISGIRTTGYHRTRSEIDSEDLITEKNWVIGFTLKPHGNLETSFIFTAYNYSPRLNNNTAALGENTFRRRYFELNDSNLKIVSAAYNYQYNNLHISGEYALPVNYLPATSHQIYYNLYDLRFGIKVWHFSRDYQAPDGRVFDDSDIFPRATQGIFAAVNYKLLSNIQLSFYRIFQKDLWRTFFEPLPTDKSEWLGQLDWKHNNTLYSLRIRQKQNSDYNIALPAAYVKQNNLRFQITYEPSKRVRLKSRYENTFIKNSSEKGILFFQDIIYDWQNSIRFYTRFTFFKTTSFSSAIYEFENDLPGSFANRALFGEGHKIYVMFKLIPLKFLDIWIKGSYLNKTDIKDTGKSINFLDREIKLQVSLNL